MTTLPPKKFTPQLTLGHPLTTKDGNSTNTTSTLLAELESILQTFPEISQDEILQHLHSVDPVSYLALDNANDMLTCSQMLKAPDMQQFLDAESNKINGLLKMNAWKYRHISTLPPGAQLINSVWSYCQKRTVDGYLLKYKAHLCANGWQQQYGIDFLNHKPQ